MGEGGGAAVVFGRVAGFFVADLVDFLAVDGAAGDNSTTTGLGRNLGGSPVDVIVSSFSVSGWYPLRVNVIDDEASTGSASEHGVRQFCPLEAFASAPGGSDSRLTVSRKGPDLNPAMSDEHAASAATLPITARNRWIMLDSPTQAASRRSPHGKDTSVVARVQHGVSFFTVLR